MQNSRDVLAGKKILFCPHEIGGQMQVMVEELRRRGYDATSASYTQEWFGHMNDINLHVNGIKNPIKKQLTLLDFAVRAAREYDIFHFFWGESLYGSRFMPHCDLPILRLMGKRIFVHFRGIELIDIKYFDYLRSRIINGSMTKPPMQRPDQIRSLKKWRQFSHRMLVSEPDLLEIVPEALLVQQAIDLKKWRPARPYPKSREDGIIRIAHAPSMRRKKGTEFVEKAVQDLKRAGYKVELVLIEKVCFDKVKSLYEVCDIGVDQVLYGWYGKVSVELMALGKPVICYIDKNLAKYREDLPVINSGPDKLFDELKALIDNAQLRSELGKRGQEYVNKYHDVGSIIGQCLDLYRRSYK